MDAYYDDAPIICKVTKDNSLYISAEGLALPCCWTAGRMYKWWHADYRIEQIWDFIDAAGGKEGTEGSGTGKGNEGGGGVMSANQVPKTYTDMFKFQGYISGISALQHSLSGHGYRPPEDGRSCNGHYRREAKGAGRRRRIVEALGIPGQDRAAHELFLHR